MESFKWGPQFITNIPKIDSQHQALVDMINTFDKSLSEDFLNDTFGKLAKYAQFHFDTEEALMTKVGVDKRHLRLHLGQHADFVSDLSNLIDTIDVHNPTDYHSLFEYLTHWLAYHILVADKNLARQIKAIESGQDAEEAFRDGEQRASGATEPLLVALNGLFTLVSKRNKALVELSCTLERRVVEGTLRSQLRAAVFHNLPYFFPQE